MSAARVGTYPPIIATGVVKQTVVGVLRERGREVFRQIKAPNRRNTGSIPRLGNAELAEKIRPRRGLTSATGC